MVEDRLNELGYKLPKPTGAPANFKAVSQYNGIAYVSGTLPYVDGKLPQVGKVGDTVTVEEAQELAIICVLNMLANLKEEIGSLDKVKQILKITGFVASVKEFNDQGLVMNAASDLLVDLFADQGMHARSAVGAPVMPKNTPVEIEMIVAVGA